MNNTEYKPLITPNDIGQHIIYDEQCFTITHINCATRQIWLALFETKRVREQCLDHVIKTFKFVDERYERKRLEADQLRLKAELRLKSEKDREEGEATKLWLKMEKEKREEERLIKAGRELIEQYERN